MTAANQRDEPRCALITGGASGFGFATAHALLDQGARAAIGDVDEGKLQSAAEVLDHDRLLTLRLDVTSASSAEAAVAACQKAFGGLDTLVNCAGILEFSKFVHRESVLERPEEIVDFMERNSDLKICIDYSHCVSIGHKEDELHALLPYAGHVHLRQGANEKIQARWDEGEINFPGLMRRLQDTGYDGYATLEYEHEEFWDMDKCDFMTETIKMRDAVLPFTS